MGKGCGVVIAPGEQHALFEPTPATCDRKHHQPGQKAPAVTIGSGSQCNWISPNAHGRLHVFIRPVLHEPCGSFCVHKRLPERLAMAA